MFEDKPAGSQSESEDRRKATVFHLHSKKDLALAMALNSSSSAASMYLACQNSIGGKITNTLFSLFSAFLLLPLYILILSMGLQRWRRRRANMSHTDFFTYNMMLLELCCVLGSALYTLSLYMDSVTVFLSGMFLFSISLPTQTLFHVLTSVERYLAVLHPVSYMRLRESQGVRIRNVATVCVWLLGFGWTEVTAQYLPAFPTVPFFSLLGLCLAAMLFCCLSVLQALTRSRVKEQADRAKRKALYMISAISGALLARVGGLSLCLGLSELTLMELEDLCAVMDSGMWLTVPSSLVLPLLFLHRAGKLSCTHSKFCPKCF